MTAGTAPPTSESSSPVVSQDRTLGLVIYLLFIRLEYELYVKSRACLFLRARPNAQRCARSTVIAPSLIAAAIHLLAKFVELIAAVLMMRSNCCGDNHWQLHKQCAKAAILDILYLKDA